MSEPMHSEKDIQLTKLERKKTKKNYLIKFVRLKFK